MPVRRNSAKCRVTTAWQDLLGELEALEADMAAEAETGDTPCYLMVCAVMCCA